MRRHLLATLLGLLAVPLAAQNPPVSAERLRQQRDSLARIRTERLDLQRKMRSLQATAHDLSEERTNLERQADATARAVRALDQQIVALADAQEETTGNLARAQDELAIKRSILRHRVREIYKRGALYSFEALLSAESFGELVARYKYLHLVAQRDRVLVGRVETLGSQISAQRTVLGQLKEDVEMSRQEKADEERRLRALEQQHGRSLRNTQAQQQRTEARIAQIARDEARLSEFLASLDATRRRTEGRAGGAVSLSTLRSVDYGQLDWPAQGDILYNFGRLVNPNNTAISWHGVGIAAEEGSPVRAVSPGTVVYAASNSTYGLQVILDHGAGDYSIYASLGRLLVEKDAKVVKGQTIGTVGQSDPDMPPRLHFEIRRNGGRAVDPLEWLRSRP